MRKILVPIDFSDPSAQAATWAFKAAPYFGAELTLLHVLRHYRNEFALTEPDVPAAREFLAARRVRATELLEAVPVGSTADTLVHREVVEGDAAEEIIRRAHNGGFDAIVMSTRGAGTLQRWLLVGSVTSKVLYGAQCPVVSASCFATTAADLPPKRVLCAVDLGPQSERAIRWAAQLATVWQSGMSVVHVAPALTEDARDIFDASMRAALANRLREKVDAIQSKLRIEAETMIEFGDPPDAIAGLARRHEAGLVVLGRGTHSDLLGRLRASGYDIIRQAPCPVVTI